MLPVVSQLKHLDISTWNKVSTSTFDQLATKISQTNMINLESLILSGYFLVDEIMLSLSKFAYKIKKLDMSNCLSLSAKNDENSFGIILISRRQKVRITNTTKYQS